MKASTRQRNSTILFEIFCNEECIEAGWAVMSRKEGVVLLVLVGLLCVWLYYLWWRRWWEVYETKVQMMMRMTSSAIYPHPPIPSIYLTVSCSSFFIHSFLQCWYFLMFSLFLSRILSTFPISYLHFFYAFLFFFKSFSASIFLSLFSSALISFSLSFYSVSPFFFSSLSSLM